MELKETNLDSKLVEALGANNIHTKQNLNDFIQAGGDLAELTGIGKATKEKILAWFESQDTDPEEPSDVDAGFSPEDQSMDGPVDELETDEADPPETDQTSEVETEESPEALETNDEPEVVPFVDRPEVLPTLSNVIRLNQRALRKQLDDFSPKELSLLEDAYGREHAKRSRMLLDVYNQYQQRKIDERDSVPAETV